MRYVIVIIAAHYAEPLCTSNYKLRLLTIVGTVLCLAETPVSLLLLQLTSHLLDST